MVEDFIVHIVARDWCGKAKLYVCDACGHVIDLVADAKRAGRNSIHQRDAALWYVDNLPVFEYCDELVFAHYVEQAFVVIRPLKGVGNFWQCACDSIVTLNVLARAVGGCVGVVGGGVGCLRCCGGLLGSLARLGG